MSSQWRRMKVPLRMQLGDATLLAPTLLLDVREVGLAAMTAARPEPIRPEAPIGQGSDGYLERSLPVSQPQPKLRKIDGMLVYVPSQYDRYYVDLQQSFADYSGKFSSKTRSTIQRKIRRFAEYCGGSIEWKAYDASAEVGTFHALARRVSAASYQERLLGCGLPDSADFVRAMETAADEGNFRGYILFHAARPVAYICCPVKDGVVAYEYVGYDPEFEKWSVGTVLQWLALESLFAEGRFKVFDFTEGQSDHKRLFATGGIRCANVFILRGNWRNRMLVALHRAVSAFSVWFGELLARHGLKARVRRLIRHGR